MSDSDIDRHVRRVRENRIALARDLATILSSSGWTPDLTLEPSHWMTAIQAVMAYRGKSEHEWRRAKPPSEETKELTLKLLNEHYQHQGEGE